MRNPTPQESTLSSWWRPEHEDGVSILVAMLYRPGRSARLCGDASGCATRYRDVLGRALRAGVRRPPGIRASRNRRRIGLASRRDFHEGRGGAHAAHGADRVHLRRDQPFSDRRKHSWRGCLPCVFDSAVRRRAPACGSRLLCRREADQEARARMRRCGHLSLRMRSPTVLSKTADGREDHCPELNQRSRTPMKSLKMAISGVCACLIASAQIPEGRPQVAGRGVQEGQMSVVYVAPRFATAIRMPDAVNSVVLGDPVSSTAEHSEREPQIVFVKPITAKAAQTNLLISTAHGYQANLLLISRGEAAETQPDVDFMMRYRPAGRFVIEPSAPSLSIAQTVALPTSGQAPATPAEVRPAAQNADAALGFDALLERQRRAPLPTLYGEKPGTAPPGKQILKAGVSEVIDQGKDVVVLFSVVNVQNHAVELMPPQVQLGGKVKKGTIVRHFVWSNSEQLPVEDFRMSQRRIGPGERADGVLIFQRPSFKQSNETLLLQVADSGAVDRPALAPIGFGISSLRKEGGE